MNSSQKTQDWCNKIYACKSDQEIDGNVDMMLTQCPPGDPPFLSDLIVNVANGAQPVLLALGELASEEHDDPEGQRYKWKLKVLRDEWGNEPQPGDKVVRRMQINLYQKEGKPWPSTELSRAKVDGSYERRFVKQVQYTVDEKGCIDVPFRDAVYFLNTHGIHAYTGVSLTTKPETSSEPVLAPDGQKYHVWYWRYKEVSPGEYAQLKKLAASTEPKRGFAKQK